MKLNRTTKSSLLFKIIAGGLACLSLQPSLAQDKDTDSGFPQSTFGVRAGSIGWGFEVSTRVNEPLYLRAVWQTLDPGEFDIQTGLIPDLTLYNAQGHFRTSGVIADWYPWDSAIRFSFGVLNNNSRFTVTEKNQPADPNSPLNHYAANFGKLGYYFGTGWAPRNNNHRFTLTIDAGLQAQQPPRVTWKEDNLARTPSQEDRIWSERLMLMQELEEYKILPFFMVGLNYQFF